MPDTCTFNRNTVLCVLFGCPLCVFIIYSTIILRQLLIIHYNYSLPFLAMDVAMNLRVSFSASY